MCLQYTNSLSPKLRSSRRPFQLQIVKKKKCFNSNDLIQDLSTNQKQQLIGI